jgi:hypothetical protein
LLFAKIDETLQTLNKELVKKIVLNLCREALMASTSGFQAYTPSKPNDASINYQELALMISNHQSLFLIMAESLLIFETERWTLFTPSQNPYNPSILSKLLFYLNKLPDSPTLP